MGFASEMHRMYDRAEGWSRFYFHRHAEARARVEELEGQVAQLQQRLAVYEPPPAEQDPQDRESSEPMEMEEEGEGSVPIGRSDFEELRPPVFTKCPEPLDTDDWLRTIRSKFTLLPELTEQREGAVCRAILCKDQRARGMPRSSKCSGLGMSPPGRSLPGLSGLTISRTA
ncbi:hypothetical protein U9M48_024651 [Paspalum notatum var. saurae]|uniref:Uncharacterized protein n=1 Tax=Paspalum notatum var. saurae TaxID=547442 RepID=A0AAQ3TP82_PASNO